MLASAAVLERRTRLAGREPARFAIGFMPGTDATPMIREFSRQTGYLNIEVVFTSLADQVDFLVDGRVDVCFVRQPLDLPLAGEMFEVLPLFPEPQVVAVPSSHPVAQPPLSGRQRQPTTEENLEQFAQLAIVMLGGGPGLPSAGPPGISRT